MEPHQLIAKARELEKTTHTLNALIPQLADALEREMKENAKLRALIERSKGALVQAMTQWRGYAEGMIACEDEDYHIPTATDLEGLKYQEGLKVVSELEAAMRKDGHE